MSIDLTKHQVLLSLLPGTAATDYMTRLVDAGYAGVSWYQNAPTLIAELQRVHAALDEAVELLRRTSAEMTASGWAACDGVHSDIIDAIAKHGGGK